MAVLALILYALCLALTVGVRTLIQVRRTGSTGFHRLVGRPGSADWIAAVGLMVALLLGGASPLLVLLDLVEPIAALDTAAVHVVGLMLALAGIAATFLAQLAMGTSWRVGVDPGERTELVIDGPFAFVRNPIFAAILPTALGLALLVPIWPAILGLAGLAFALEFQVRVVEEPYLLHAHGDEFAQYAARVGRFFPYVGRMVES